MKVISYEGVVENGCIHVPAGVSLPEKAKVYVIVPGVYESDVRQVVHISSPRLVHPEQANDFIMEVRDVKDDK